MMRAGISLIIAIALSFCSIGLAGAQESPRTRLEEALNRSTICADLPPLNACQMAEAAGIEVGKVCSVLPGNAVTIAFEESAHRMRYEDRFAYSVNGYMVVSVELGCQTGAKAIVKNLRIPERVTCTARIAGQCSVRNIDCKPSGEAGKLLAVLGDLNARMKGPLEEAAALTAICG